MHISVRENQIMDILKDFHEVTGLRIGLFGLDGCEIKSYPAKISEFCSLIRLHKNGNLKCLKCDKKAFEVASQTGKLYAYKCHMGLTEAVLPVMYDGVVLAFLMFGQVYDTDTSALNTSNSILNQEDASCRITDKTYTSNAATDTSINDKKEVSKSDIIDLDTNELEYILNINKFLYETAALEESTASVNQEREKLLAAFKSINVMHHEKIVAIGKMMDILASYIKFSDLIYTYTGGMAMLIKSYIEQNIDKELTIEIICKKLGVGKTSACKKFKDAYNITINHFINETRITKAIKLIRNTDMTIADVSYACGYSDYNYFIRVFKKHTKLSPLKYKNSINNNKQ